MYCANLYFKILLSVSGVRFLPVFLVIFLFDIMKVLIFCDEMILKILVLMTVKCRKCKCFYDMGDDNKILWSN